MKLRIFVCFRSSAIAGWLLASLLATPTQAARLVVSNSATPCAGAQFTSIQAAINAAAAGDTLTVCSGTYAEQLAITKSLRIEAQTGAFLVPGAIQQNAMSLATGDAIAAAVLVSGATNVAISGLTVDGINNGIVECAPRLIGVYFQNSTGSLRHAAIRNFKLSAGLNGCQSGTGVFVESGNGQNSNVEIADCSIHDFQKNGITANEPGTSVDIVRNAVTGLGPTTGAAQNGIQIGFSATGAIRGNIVTNSFWAPCTSTLTCQTVATGILVIGSDDVSVTDNTAGIAQVGIFVDGNNATVSDNRVFAASVFENITVVGNGNKVQRNDIFNGGDANVFVQGNNNTISHNSITEAPVGILEAQGATGNVFAGNSFFDVAVTIQDPPAGPLSQRIVPDR